MTTARLLVACFDNNQWIFIIQTERDGCSQSLQWNGLKVTMRIILDATQTIYSNIIFCQLKMQHFGCTHAWGPWFVKDSSWKLQLSVVKKNMISNFTTTEGIYNVSIHTQSSSERHSMHVACIYTQHNYACKGKKKCLWPAYIHELSRLTCVWHRPGIPNFAPVQTDPRKRPPSHAAMACKTDRPVIYHEEVYVQ